MASTTQNKKKKQSIITPKRLDPLDELFIDPRRVYKEPLLADMKKAILAAYPIGLPTKTIQTIEEAEKGDSPDHLFYWIFGLAISTPQCGSILFNYNHHAPRTASWLNEVKDVYLASVLTLRLAGVDAAVPSSNNNDSKEITIESAIQLAGNCRRMYTKSEKKK